MERSVNPPPNLWLVQLTFCMTVHGRHWTQRADSLRGFSGNSAGICLAVWLWLCFLRDIYCGMCVCVCVCVCVLVA